MTATLAVAPVIETPGRMTLNLAATDAPRFAPRIVAVGGTLRTGSSTERALRIVLAAAERAGAQVQMISGPDLDMPLFAPEKRERHANAARLIEALRGADGIVLGSPSYHGSISGVVKNALDYTEDMRGDPAPYFHQRAVASVGTGGGYQGAVAALNALRGIVHALRGWNSPLGVAINTAEPVFDAEGRCLDPKLQAQLEAQGEELVAFARRRLPVDAASPRTAG